MKVRNLTRAGVKRRFEHNALYMRLGRALVKQLETIMTDAAVKIWTSCEETRCETLKLVADSFQTAIAHELERRLAEDVLKALQ